ncbi:hypothetical protein EVAR_32113_1 [Eumeta japonica]|uniref:Ionotropic glutamate receptor C-terminal domain-containing protein n=1 Tax=Eumeta variegata TaxID=151549 RepID=A0A4C1V5Z3_EUMVA|nr:hypothetical protein EVAR_32113_1 [Eumeta japonica]
MYVCVRLCVLLRAHGRARVCQYVRVCARARACVCTPLFIYKERTHFVEYLMLPATSTVKFVFRQPPLSSHYNLYLLPFNSKVWDLMMEPEGKHRNSIIKQRILAVFGLVEIVLRCTLTMNDFQGLMMQLEGILGRSVIFMTCVTYTFLYTSYSANVVALLQSRSSHIRTMDDLFNSKLEIGIHDTPYNKVLFNSVIKDPMHYAPYYTIGPRKKKLTFMDLEEGVKKMQEDQFAFFMDRGIGYIYVNKYFEEGQKCALHEITYEQGQDAWLAARKNTPYREMFKIGLHRIKEHGLDTREYLKIYAEKPKCLGSGGSFVNVSVMDCYPAFLMLIYGYTVAFSLLVMEVLSHCHKNNMARC